MDKVFYYVYTLDENNIERDYGFFLSFANAYNKVLSKIKNNNSLNNYYEALNRMENNGTVRIGEFIIDSREFQD